MRVLFLKVKRISSGLEPFYCVGRYFVVLSNITFRFSSQVRFYTEQKLIKTRIFGSKRNEILDVNNECDLKLFALFSFGKTLFIILSEYANALKSVNYEFFSASGIRYLFFFYQRNQNH